MWKPGQIVTVRGGKKYRVTKVDNKLNIVVCDAKCDAWDSVLRCKNPICDKLCLNPNPKLGEGLYLKRLDPARG